MPRTPGNCARSDREAFECSWVTRYSERSFRVGCEQRVIVVVVPSSPSRGRPKSQHSTIRNLILEAPGQEVGRNRMRWQRCEGLTRHNPRASPARRYLPQCDCPPARPCVDLGMRGCHVAVSRRLRDSPKEREQSLDDAGHVRAPRVIERNPGGRARIPRCGERPFEAPDGCLLPPRFSLQTTPSPWP